MIFDLVLSSCHENCQLNVVEDPWLTCYLEALTRMVKESLAPLFKV